MVSYLDLLNKARRQNGDGDITLTALQTNAQGSQSNVEFVDEIVSYAYERSQDWGFNDIITTVTTTASNPVVTAPASPTIAWEPEAIKEVRIVKNNDKTNLFLITPSRADEIELQFSEAEPVYWYIDSDQELKLLPVPNAVYTLSVRYQGLIPQITDLNINDTIVIPVTLQKALVQGIYSWLLREDSDPDWERQYALFENKLDLALSRNRSNYKRQGIKKWGMKTSPDFRL